VTFAEVLESADGHNRRVAELVAADEIGEARKATVELLMHAFALGREHGPGVPPFTDPSDPRLISGEWDATYGFMIGRLLAHGYTPAQIQVKARNTASMIAGIVMSPEGQEAGQDVQRGIDSLKRMVEDEVEGQLDQEDGEE
jgi:hypothetical protein